MKDKVILIYPHDDRSIHWFPFSLMVVATVLKAEGLQPVIVDQRVQSNWRGIIQDNLQDALFVGFTVMIGPTIRNALQCAEYVNNICPEIPKVFGGYHASLLHRQTVDHPLVDYVYMGAAELEIVDLCRFLQGRGMAYDQFSHIVSKKDRNRDPKYRAYTGVDGYDSHWRKGYECLPDLNVYRSINNMAGMFMARSCPFKCAFCAITKIYRYKARDTDCVIEELRYLVDEQGFSNIALMDGLTFIGRQSVDLWERILDSGLKFEWLGRARVDSFCNYTSSDMATLRNSGLRMVDIGFESGSDRMLVRMNKKAQAMDAIEVVKLLNEWDIDVNGSFMTGLPGETIEDLQRTIELIEKILSLHDKFHCNVNIYSPVPGSKTYNEAVEAGYAPCKSLEEWGNVGWGNRPSKFPWMSAEAFDDFMKLYYSRFGEVDYYDNKSRERASWKHQGERSAEKSA